MGKLIQIQREALGCGGLGPAEYPVRKKNRCDYLPHSMIADTGF